jgi:hypothetical protein
MRRQAKWGCTRQSPQWSAQAMQQRLSSGFALAGYELPRSGLVQLPVIASTGTGPVGGGVDADVF